MKCSGSSDESTWGLERRLSRTQGAQIVYQRLEPVLVQHEGLIDAKIDQLQEHAKQGAVWVASEGFNIAKRGSIQLAGRGQQLLAQAVLTATSQMPPVQQPPAAPWPTSPFQSASAPPYESASSLYPTSPSITPFPSAPSAAAGDDIYKVE